MRPSAEQPFSGLGPDVVGVREPGRQQREKGYGENASAMEARIGMSPICGPIADNSLTQGSEGCQGASSMVRLGRPTRRSDSKVTTPNHQEMQLMRTNILAPILALSLAAAALPAFADPGTRLNVPQADG